MVAPRSWPWAVGSRCGSRWSARSGAAARTTDLDARGPGGRLTGRGRQVWRWPGAVGTGRVGGEPRSSLYRLLVGGPGRMGGASLRWRTSVEGRLCGQRFCGACRSEGLGGGEHVPDRLGEPAGQVDPGDPGAALAAQPGLGPLVTLGVGGMAGGVGGRLDQRPAQVLRAVLGE